MIPAAPATASTLSSDIDRSARMMVQSALQKVVGLACGAVEARLLSTSSIECVSLSTICLYIFQQTNKSRMPPANVRPITCSICCAMLAKRILRTTAPAMPQKMTLARIVRLDARCRHADDDGVVAGERQVDHQDVEQRHRVGSPPLRRNKVSRGRSQAPTAGRLFRSAASPSVSPKSLECNGAGRCTGAPAVCGIDGPLRQPLR